MSVTMTSLLPAGTILQNRYQIQRLLGQGGMGAVYLARDQRLDKLCAVKETLDVSPRAQQQFQREARFLAHLDHPHLPRVTDYFAQTGRYYLVMDYVEGLDLADRVEQQGPAPSAQALAWADQVLDALDYLHSQDPAVIHRDVKPANIKVTPAGPKGQASKAMLVDFGIAKEYVQGQHTMTGALALSPGFAPLEQYATRGQTDARTDLYGVGGTLYYLLTGVAPVESLNRGAGAPLPGLREANPGAQVSAAVEDVVLKAMALQKQDRWQSAAEMRRALAQAALRPAGLGVAARAAALPPTRLMGRRADPLPTQGEGLDRKKLPWFLAGVAVALLLLLGLLALMTGNGRDGRTEQGRPTELLEVALNPPGETATLRPTATRPAPEPTATLRAAPNPTSLPAVAPSATPARVQPTPTPIQPTSTTPPTDAPTQRPADTATQMAVPTRTLAPTRTPRPTVSQAATATRAAPPTATAPRPPSTRPPPTRTQPPRSTGNEFPAPVLRGPAGGQAFSGDEPIVLEWAPVGQLPADGFYAVTVTYPHGGDTWTDDVPWTKGTSWTMSEHKYLPDLSTNGEFRWSVRAMLKTGEDAQGKPRGTPLSPASAVRLLTWKRSGGGGGGGGGGATVAPP